MDRRLDNIQVQAKNIDEIPETYKLELQMFLLNVVKSISCDIIAIREIRRKKEYCKSKLIERGGESDWRKGKFVYAVSAIIAFVHDIDEYLKSACELRENICLTVASLNGRGYVAGETINIHETPLFVDIQRQKENLTNAEESTRLMKQRSNEWFEYRKRAKVTGSSLFTAIGGDGLKRQKDHFDKVMCGIAEKDPTLEQKKAIEHGVVNEINGVATLVGKVLPVVEPDLTFCEEGCVAIQTADNDCFMIVSPDGSLREDSDISTTKVGVEIKCPYYRIHNQFPVRYLLQCLSQIEVLNVNYLLFVSWTAEETVVFRVKRDCQLFQEAMKIAFAMYGHDKVNKPTKLSEEQKKLKERLTEISKQVEFVGTFSSLVHSSSTTLYSQPIISIWDVKAILHKVKAEAEAFYELNRERATEAVVFLVSDLDRSWDKENVKWSPVAWFPKGYSLTTGTMRSIAEDVHDRCYEQTIHIPCSSFDGQWHGIVVRTKTGQPLTKLQLQKDVWKNVIDMSKSEIISTIKQINRQPMWSFKINPVSAIAENNVTIHVIEAEYQKKCPKFRPHSNEVSTNETVEEKCKPKFTLADSVPDEVMESENANTQVLNMTVITEPEEVEAFLANINAEEWTEQLLEVQSEEQKDEIDEQIEVGERQQDTTNNQAVPSCSISLSNNSESRQSMLTSHDFSCILALLKTTQYCNKRQKWDDLKLIEFEKLFQTYAGLQSFLDVELRTIARYLKKSKGVQINESNTKKSKIKTICNYLKIECPALETNRKVIRRAVKSLSETALAVIAKKLTKHELSVWYA
ncbi:hypothetical protein DPMN_084577 [Dreissena polymorpha]|uniref:YqaJ viral recombinase domain-containing protein n=1 Tax=Dreissena polymorpha TaxID=45954 RepID=A0A9D3YC17_DREPO|nr:hypothetical protein DPMN_084577 [Dreissena polymorpha]